MDITTQLFILFSTLIFTISTISSQSPPSCQPDSCNSKHGPSIRFPFRLKNRQPARCGYPGFDLHCNDKNQTILNLPQSGNFIVDRIDYEDSHLHISDPASCLAKRALNFTLSGSPFRAPFPVRYVFLNCTKPVSYDAYKYTPMFCMREGETRVLAADWRKWRADGVPVGCRKMADVRVPLQWYYAVFNWVRHEIDLSGDFEVSWREPKCGKCENHGGVCGFKNDTGLEIQCTGASWLSNDDKDFIFAFGLVLGILLIVCTIGLVIFAYDKITDFTSQRLPTTTVSYRPLPARANTPPPTLVVRDESRRVPNPRADGDTCPICLCEYKSKEIDLKIISGCNHCFHASCVNERFKINRTCPMCRKQSNWSF